VVGWRDFIGTDPAAQSILFLFLQKTLIPYVGLKLLIPLFVLSAGSVLQVHGQTTSVHVSSSAPRQLDLPDAPSASPTHQQSPSQTFDSYRHGLAGVPALIFFRQPPSFQLGAELYPNRRREPQWVERCLSSAVCEWDGRLLIAQQARLRDGDVEVGIDISAVAVYARL
jgi:hypothetical protein